MFISILFNVYCDKILVKEKGEKWHVSWYGENSNLPFLIDDIIVSLIFILIIAIFYSRLPKIDFSLKTRFVSPIYYVISWGLIIIYYCIIPLFYKAQTLVRRAMKIKVVHNDGAEMTFGNFFVRDIIGFFIIVRILIGVCFIGLIVNIILLCKDDSSTIHDNIADTRMIEY